MQVSLAKWPRSIATISIAQLFGTSLWFSANGAADDLMHTWHVSASDVGWLTNAVQAGFILGTLGIALSGLADRYKASSIFVCAAVTGSIFNLSFSYFATGLSDGLVYRFLVGVCLSGIYPMGMKMIVSWAPDRAGWGLAQLVGMLTLGTALPHALKLVGSSYPWQAIIGTSSALALVGAVMIFFLGEGPYTRSLSNVRDQGDLVTAGLKAIFKNPIFRAAAFGYFGHMWELYAFWTIVPMYVAKADLPASLNLGGVAGHSFVIIGAGAFGCLIGGAFSRRYGSASVAGVALALSGLCCITFALLWRWMSPSMMLLVLILWGASVVADSPQFSAVSAKACPPKLVGSALAIQNSFGFAITVVSIAVVASLFEHIGLDSAWLLLLGPTLGLIGFWPCLKATNAHQTCQTVGPVSKGT
jgi:MFS family permease